MPHLTILQTPKIAINLLAHSLVHEKSSYKTKSVTALKSSRSDKT